MLPIVSIVGQSQSGKTTLVERLVVEFKGRGYRVATVKHACKDFDIDKQGKDTWRYTEAGSDAVAISAPQRLALIKLQDDNDSIDEILRLLGEDFDIIFIEGFHQAHVPKIEVYRKELNKGLRCDPGELKAIVSDDKLDVRGDDTLLFVNGSPVILNQFARQIFANTLLGMVSSLKGVTEVRSLEVAVRKKGI